MDTYKYSYMFIDIHRVTNAYKYQRSQISININEAKHYEVNKI
jgi:hypothetical protein